MYGDQMTKLPGWSRIWKNKFQGHFQDFEDTFLKISHIRITADIIS